MAAGADQDRADFGKKFHDEGDADAAEPCCRHCKDGHGDDDTFLSSWEPVNLFAEDGGVVVVDKGAENEPLQANVHCHSRELLLLEEEASAVAAGVLLLPRQHLQSRHLQTTGGGRPAVAGDDYPWDDESWEAQTTAQRTS